MYIYGDQKGRVKLSGGLRGGPRVF